MERMSSVDFIRPVGNYQNTYHFFEGRLLKFSCQSGWAGSSDQFFGVVSCLCLMPLRFAILLTGRTIKRKNRANRPMVINE